MSHNISLPRHRYVWVVPDFVRPAAYLDLDIELIPAVWWGISVTPSRTLACHIALHDGAMVLDLPLHALRSCVDAEIGDLDAIHATWDCYGWDAEIVECDYLTDMRVELLDEHHRPSLVTGRLWFAVDHIKDGFSTTPMQHKFLWVVADDHGGFHWVPQDQILLRDKSFTETAGIPRIKRQSVVWGVE